MSGTELGHNPTLDDVLAHHGVKGMQWGKHKTESGGSSEGGGGSKKASSEEILAARRNQMKKALAYHDAKAVAKTTAKGSVERAMANKDVADLKADFLKSPDRVTASRMTKGEKAITGALIGSVVMAPTGLAVAAVNVGTRKVIESKQRRGAYDK